MLDFCKISVYSRSEILPGRGTRLSDNQLSVKPTLLFWGYNNINSIFVFWEFLKIYMSNLWRAHFLYVSNPSSFGLCNFQKAMAVGWNTTWIYHFSAPLVLWQALSTTATYNCWNFGRAIVCIFLLSPCLCPWEWRTGLSLTVTFHSSHIFIAFNYLHRRKESC